MERHATSVHRLGPRVLLELVLEVAAERAGVPRVAAVLARYAANSPHAMLPQYVASLKQYRAIQLDVGLQDFLLNDNKEMDRLLTQFSVAHTYETYEGNHVDHIAERFEQKVLAFFSQHLEFASPK